MPGFRPAQLYAQQVDDVPAYQPEAITLRKDAGYVLPDGSIRVIGPEDLSGIITHLNAVFMQSHPGIKLTYVPANSLAAMDCLIFDTTAVAFSEQDFAPSLTYSDIVHGDPFSIRLAHASLQPAAALSPLAVIVNPMNPMTTITMKQLTGIFSQATRVREDARWSQVGVDGKLASLDIRPSGLPWSDHYRSEDTTFGDFFFFRKLGATEPVRYYRMFGTYDEVVADVAAHPTGIGVTTLNHVTPGVKVLAISRGDARSPSSGSEADIRNGSYPLDRYIRVYGRVTSGKPMDPFVREYFRLLLSKGAQRIITEDSHGYLPLNPYEVHEDLATFQ